MSSTSYTVRIIEPELRLFAYSPICLQPHLPTAPFAYSHICLQPHLRFQSSGVEHSQDLFLESFGSSVEDDPGKSDSDEYWKLVGERLTRASIACHPEHVSQDEQYAIRAQVRAQLAARNSINGVSYEEAKLHQEKIKQVRIGIQELQRDNPRMRNE